MAEVTERKTQIKKEIDRIRNIIIKPEACVNQYLQHKGSNVLANGIRLDQLLKRVELNYGAVSELADKTPPVSNKVAQQVEIEIKYEGYIHRQQKEIEKFKHLEQIKIPSGFDYMQVHGLSNELKSKLSAIRPNSLGQASRIDGMTPAALSVLMVAFRVARTNKGA